MLYRMIYKIYQTKSVLNTHKYCDGGWFLGKIFGFSLISAGSGVVRIDIGENGLTEKRLGR